MFNLLFPRKLGYMFRTFYKQCSTEVLLNLFSCLLSQVQLSAFPRQPFLTKYLHPTGLYSCMSLVYSLEVNICYIWTDCLPIRTVYILWTVYPLYGLFIHYMSSSFQNTHYPRGTYILQNRMVLLKKTYQSKLVQVTQVLFHMFLYTFCSKTFLTSRHSYFSIRVTFYSCAFT